MKGTLTKEPRNVPEEQRQNFIAPEVNIYETPDGYLLEAEMPGVNKTGLEITLENHEITIIGRRNVERVEGELLLKESDEADYKRVFELDPAIDTSKISARMDQGILRVTLPKSEQVKPRKIAVD
jgi:HSP20 family protein